MCRHLRRNAHVQPPDCSEIIFWEHPLIHTIFIWIVISVISAGALLLLSDIAFCCTDVVEDVVFPSPKGQTEAGYLPSLERWIASRHARNALNDAPHFGMVCVTCYSVACRLKFRLRIYSVCLLGVCVYLDWVLTSCRLTGESWLKQYPAEMGFFRLVKEKRQLVDTDPVFTSIHVSCVDDNVNLWKCTSGTTDTLQ